jgi:hypothetical protein
MPQRCNRYRKETPKHPSPYIALFFKLMELASGKYFVGQLISPILNFAAMHWAMI